MLSMKGISKEQIDALIEKASMLKKSSPAPLLQGKVMASCFYEPSTRTRLSFEAAMYRLGGSVMGFSEEATTAAKKGEALFDAMKVIGNYSDLIVIRHPLEGAARLAQEASAVPVINAGDGANEHPTQTLLDLFTIWESQGTLENLKIICAGDLLYGRTVHSLIYALKSYHPRLYFVAPPELAMPQEIVEMLKEEGIPCSYHDKIDDVIKEADILYVTRVQKERFLHLRGYEKIKNRFSLEGRHLKEAPSHLKVMHPLPRNEEINACVDKTPHAHYFTQAENGLYMRQALLLDLLGDHNERVICCSDSKGERD